MTDKSINFDIDDPRASAIAEVMSNKTAKKILSLIAEKELSAGDIASELGLPINTVGYNLDKLLTAGLIEKSKTFFWSAKGKKIPTYKVSNKKIIISPKKMISSVPTAIIAGILGVVLFAILFATNSNPVINHNSSIQHFNSYNEINNYIDENRLSNSPSFLESLSNIAGGIAKTGTLNYAASSSSQDSSGANQYSQTNNQVEGVDEPDIVKNDGKYIYTISGNRVIIVNAYPAYNMTNVSEINVSSVQNIFVNGDKLVIFGSSYQSMAESSSKVSSLIAPCYYGGCGYGKQLTDVLIYNIEDRKNPKLEDNFSLEGNYVDSRMINDEVYLISSNYISDDVTPPIYYANGEVKSISADSIYYYPDYEDSQFVFTSVFSINLKNGDNSNKVYLTGSTGTTYFSEDNIYLTYQKRISQKDYSKKFINEAIIPILPADLKSESEDIMNSDKSLSEKYSEIMGNVYNYSMSLNGTDKEEFDSKLQNSTTNFAQKIAKEYEKTVIMKIHVDGANIKHIATGEVPGHVLNQFSLDEYKNDLRIATTTGDVWSGNSLNHLFILNKDMSIVGSLQGLAPGEKIYSVRFMGKRAYMVTFKKVDPLFVIDLSDSENPRVLGYLKIPGYSDYLHPYDENHVIGIGKDAIDASQVEVDARQLDFAWYQGMKVSLFDVSDVEHPIEQAKYLIGDRGTNSPVLYDHKALLFNKEKNLLVIPVSVAEVNRTAENMNTPTDYGQVVFQGAYVFNINDKEINLKGKITHSDNISSDQYGNKYYDYRTEISRSLFINDVLYTISPAMIKANDLNNMNEISNLELGYAEDNYPGPILY